MTTISLTALDDIPLTDETAAADPSATERDSSAWSTAPEDVPSCFKQGTSHPWCDPCSLRTPCRVPSGPRTPPPPPRRPSP